VGEFFAEDRHYSAGLHQQIQNRSGKIVSFVIMLEPPELNI
jgi:hypothetical protein